ncbi:MAG: HK97 gp10 family phage protein [Eubacterium sp.]
MSNDNAAFEASINNATLEIIKRAVANMDKACLVVERSGKQNCPVDLGQLRADIHHEVVTTTREINGVVGNSLDYAPMVHNGTGIYAKSGGGRKTPWKFKVATGKYKGWHTTNGQRPQPYLEKAKQENLSKISGILAGE